MSALLTGETRQDGRVIPEAEVERGSRTAGGDAGATQSFQVREAKTVHVGPCRRGKRTAGGDAGATDATLSFQVREAVTVVLPPPHWAHLKGPRAGTPAPLEE